MDEEYLPITQAAKRFGVSYQTLWRLVRAGRLSTYQSQTNRRVKLVKRADVEALMVPKPIAAGESWVAGA